MNWYYVEQGRQAGPVSDEQLEGKFRVGQITPTTLIWREGMPNWLPYSQVKPAAAPGATAETTGPAAEAVCSECGKMFPMAETIRYGNANVCATCKPVFLQRVREGARVGPAGMNYAGFWIRFAAKLLDGLIVGVIFGVPLLIIIFMMVANEAKRSTALHFGADLSPHATGDTTGVIVNVVFMIIELAAAVGQVLYAALFVGKYGATPGKMVCGLLVVDADGNRIGYGRSFGRAFAEILSRMICSIGYLIAAFDNPQKRALHDHICNTRVIYKNG